MLLMMMMMMMMMIMVMVMVGKRTVNFSHTSDGGDGEEEAGKIIFFLLKFIDSLPAAQTSIVSQ